MKSLLFVAFCVGCSVSGEPEHQARDCAVEFTPIPELMQETLVAAERWSAAASCDIYVGDNGLPIELTDSIPRPCAAGSLCRDSSGATNMATVQGVRVATGLLVHRLSVDRYRTVMHEMGHAIGGHGHTDSIGIMSADGSDDRYINVIDSTSLALVCETLDCGIMAPEQP